MRKLRSLLSARALLILMAAVLGTVALADQAEWTGSCEMDGPPALGGWFGEQTSSEVQDGVLHIVDPSTARGSGHCFEIEWEAEPDQEAIAEARMRVVAAEGAAGVCLLLANGVNEEIVEFETDGVRLRYAELTHEMDTTDDFHVYRATAQGGDVKLWVDGEMVLDGPGRFTHPAYEGRNRLSFGSASSNATGESYWDWVRFRSPLVVQISAVPPGAAIIDIYRQPDTYAVFPSLGMDPETERLATGFRAGGPRSHINAQGAGHVTMSSEDGGRTWAEGPRLSSPPFTGPDGRQIRVACKWWQHHPAEERAELEAQGYEVRDVREGVVAICAGAYMTWSDDGGEKWERRDLDLPFTALLASGMNWLQLADGTILFPVYGSKVAGGPNCSWVLRSTDYGESWVMAEVGSLPDRPLNEPAIVQTASGRLLIVMRTGTGSDHMWQAVSDDGGATWHGLQDTGVKGHPPNLLLLQDGRILLSYGHRHAPLSVRAVVSADGGQSWDLEHIWALREGGGSNDLGYPRSVQLGDGTVVTIYYFVEPGGMQFVGCTRWLVPE